MRKPGRPTKHKGIEQLEPNRFRVRAKVYDPRTGKPKEVDRVIGGPGVTILDAVKQRAAWIQEIKQGGAVVGERVRKTFSDFARSFVAAKRVSLEQESAEVYASALESFASLADVFVDAITTQDVQRIVNSLLDEGQKASTVRNKVKVLRSAFKFGMKQTPPMVDRDPTRAVSLPKMPKANEKANRLSADELAKALCVAEADFTEHYAILLVLACTGLRYTHVSALRWEDVDFDQGVIRFERKQIVGRVAPITEIKACPAELPLQDRRRPELKVLEQALRDHRARLLAVQHKGLSAGWCFPSKDGDCDTWAETRKQWGKIQAKAGIARPCTIHGLRHTFNDLTRYSGIDPLVIRSITQHKTDDQRWNYSAIDLGEQAKAVGGILKLVKGGDAGGDATDANKTPPQDSPAKTGS